METLQDSNQLNLITDSPDTLPLRELLAEQDLSTILKASLAAGAVQALAAHLFLQRLSEGTHGSKKQYIAEYLEKHEWKRSTFYHKAKVGAIVAEHLTRGIDISNKTDSDILRSAGQLPAKQQAQKNLIPKIKQPTSAAIFKQQITQQNEEIEELKNDIELISIERDIFQRRYEDAMEMVESLQEDIHERE